MGKNMDKVELIICTERGYLESMARLLIYSLREFGGEFKDIPVYSYQPRKKYKISKETVSFFDKHNVEYVDLNLNTEFDFYPLANKPLTCAHRERNTHAKILIFLDTDTFILREPCDFNNFNGADVILRPVDTKNIGKDKFHDHNVFYWDKLYSLLDVRICRTVTSTVDKKEILEYYNSGQIVSQTDNDLFTAWEDNFIKTMRSGLRPHKRLFYLEQSVFAATVAQLELEVQLADENYNFPVHLFDSITGEDCRVSEHNFVTVHYHNLFQNRDGRNPIAHILDNSENGRNINQKVEEFGLIRRVSPARRIGIKLKNNMRKVLQELAWQRYTQGNSFNR